MGESVPSCDSLAADVQVIFPHHVRLYTHRAASDKSCSVLLPTVRLTPLAKTEEAGDELTRN